MFGLREACNVAEDMKTLGLTPGLAGKRVVVQGLGNVGYHAAKFLQEEGAVLVGLVGVRRAPSATPRDSISKQVMAHRKGTGRSSGSPAPPISPTSAAALELDCDILVPAALENVITAENAPRIKAKIIGEGANGPTTNEADGDPARSAASTSSPTSTSTPVA